MYFLGGMGRSGKTQVIKALMYMSQQNSEVYRMVVLAPTGTAAALLNRSTYYYMLGLRMSQKGLMNIAKIELLL